MALDLAGGAMKDEKEISQNQRCQRPFAALILEWLGNGHCGRFIMGLTPFRRLTLTEYHLGPYQHLKPVAWHF